MGDPEINVEATDFFYDCVITGLFQVKRHLPTFLERFFSIQSSLGNDRETTRKFKEYFGSDDSEAIRPMWLSRQFILPHIGFIAGKRLGLIVEDNAISLKPVIALTPNEPFPCRLDGIAITGNRANNHSLMYMLGGVIMLSTMDLIRGKIALDVIMDQIMYSPSKGLSTA